MRSAKRITPRTSGQRLRQGFFSLLSSNPTTRLHPLQHIGLPDFRPLGMPIRTQPRRRLRQPSEQGGLGQTELCRPLAKIPLRRRLDAHNVAAKRRAVQIVRQYLALVAATLQLQRTKCFNDLSQEGAPPRLSHPDHLGGNR